ncbi:acyl carrier protein [Treponema sp.]|uniref:acyl carrier protein n=1 Tax=Treponema sp. TaxID=166 RepID=UPI003890997F
MDQLISILSEIKPDVDFTTETGLIDNALLDSFDIVQIVGRLNEEFDIEITPKDIVPENFNSAEALWKMVESLQ